MGRKSAFCGFRALLARTEAPVDISNTTLCPDENRGGDFRYGDDCNFPIHVDDKAVKGGG